MSQRKAPCLTPDEALQLHEQALIIDSQQPFIHSGIVFTPGMRETLDNLVKQGRTASEMFPILGDVLAREIQTSSEVRAIYLDMWAKSGVTAAAGTFSALDRFDTAFESAVREIGIGHAIISALHDQMILVRQASDIERAWNEKKRAIIIDFQNTVAFGDELDRIGLFHNLGLRMV